ncbi:Gfo/Idh/MocA family oxidoreductase [Flavobacteriaceae bacterium TP-CH-4]|uniref:Gfo/Idh/MocA family oxidoreductase n=1 Tax=Pelagihabitans pacificus TaxID=2696054 RepID=A0A967AYD8_9FLAO|nr:Gfo/Idh/MocA family oxidoreductase [Pelagihabitans pacificus]NHF59862.1 Gfo/Idh/MocA family oxidoreductase [Pelagihabitans pacificus]
MQNRRTFIKKSGLFLAASSLPLTSFSIPVQKKKLGVALVGLGYYSTDLLAPALQLTKHCELRGIVTGSPEKIPVWQNKYGIKDSNVYNYGNMHTIADNDDIDVVYIVLPNKLHLPYALIGAEAGKHVWCEKPMATTVDECQRMIDACQKNGVQLTIGYRMQHEPVTQKIIGWATSKPYGSIKSIYAEAGFRNGANDPTHWKINKELGGGAMFDMGVYPLNAVRYCTGLEPISVSATQENTRSHIFNADETTYFNLEFPEGITAECKTTFAEHINTLNVDCDKGGYKISPFQSYTGVQGTTSDGKVLEPFKGNQQAKQMDEDALAILSGTPNQVIVPGEEGLRDIKVVEAIFASAADGGKRITL